MKVLNILNKNNNDKIINEKIVRTIKYSPYVRVNDFVTKVMFDVILALLPAIIVSYFVYGISPVLVVLTSVVSAVLCEWLFSTIFFKKNKSIFDLSGIITGILLALTLAPFTPLPVVAFGGAMGVIFGKMVYSGLGKNMFNPAIVGREFMTVFFPTVMSSSTIWFNEMALKTEGSTIFNNDGINNLILKNSGAIGEFSVIALIIGGLYLLIKDRISWHVPATLFTVVTIGLFILTNLGYEPNLSMGGLMLGGIYMATDMPTSPTTKWGKIYYGSMIGVSVIICWLGGINFEMLSYSILILNGFAKIISEVFAPKVFGININITERIIKVALLTISIMTTAYVVTLLHHNGLISYLIYNMDS